MGHHFTHYRIGRQVAVHHAVTKMTDDKREGHATARGVNQETHGTNDVVHDLTKAEITDVRNRGIVLTNSPCVTKVKKEDMNAKEELGPRNEKGRAQRAEMK